MIGKINRKPVFLFIVGLIFVSLSFTASFLAFDVSKFYEHRHSFSYGVKNYDRDVAQKGLENMKNDYNVFSAWKLRYFADKYFFNEMYRYEAAVSILSENYEKAENVDLKDRGGNYYTSYMLGIAKFKALYLAFQKAMVKKDRKQMEAIRNLVLEEVKPDFEKCVKEGPGPDKNYECSFNYDLTSDPKMTSKALMSQKLKPTYILAPPDGQDKGPGTREPVKKEAPELGPNENRDVGQGGARKIG